MSSLPLQLQAQLVHPLPSSYLLAFQPSSSATTVHLISCAHPGDCMYNRLCLFELSQEEIRLKLPSTGPCLTLNEGRDAFSTAHVSSLLSLSAQQSGFIPSEYPLKGNWVRNHAFRCHVESLGASAALHVDAITRRGAADPTFPSNNLVCAASLSPSDFYVVHAAFTVFSAAFSYDLLFLLFESLCLSHFFCYFTFSLVAHRLPSPSL